MEELRAHPRGEIQLSETVYNVPPDTDMTPELYWVPGPWPVDADFGFVARDFPVQG